MLGDVSDTELIEYDLRQEIICEIQEKLARRLQHSGAVFWNPSPASGPGLLLLPESLSAIVDPSVINRKCPFFPII
jgi:hypothetical protein